ASLPALEARDDGANHRHGPHLGQRPGSRFRSSAARRRARCGRSLARCSMTNDNDLQELPIKAGDGEAALEVEQPEANGHDNVTPIDTARSKRETLKAPWQAKDVHEAIAICAKMDPITYEQHRETVANAFDIKRLSALDDAVKAARKKTDSGDDDVFGWTVKQAPHPVEGATVLDEIETTIRRYVVMPKAAATAIALWIAHAWT